MFAHVHFSFDVVNAVAAVTAVATVTVIVTMDQITTFGSFCLNSVKNIAML